MLHIDLSLNFWVYSISTGLETQSPALTVGVASVDGGRFRPSLDPGNERGALRRKWWLLLRPQRLPLGLGLCSLAHSLCIFRPASRGAKGRCEAERYFGW